MLSQGGGGLIGGIRVISEFQRAARHPICSSHRVLHLYNHIAGRDLRVRTDHLHGVDAAIGHPVSLKDPLAFIQCAGPGKSGDLLSQLRLVLASGLRLGEARVLHHILPPQGAAQTVKCRIPGAGDNDLSIGGGERPEGDAGGVAVAHPLGIGAKDTGIDHRVFQAGEGGIQHRHIDKLSLSGLFPVIQGRRDGAEGIQPGKHVAGRGPAAHGRAIRLTGQAHQSAHPLNDHIQRASGTVWTRIAKAGDRHINDPGIGCGNDIITQAHALHRAGFEIFHQNVRFFHQLQQHLLICLRLQVQGDALLTALDRQVVDPLPVEKRAAGLGPVRPLHLDHIRPQVRHDHRGQGTGQKLRQVHHCYPAQGAVSNRHIEPSSFPRRRQTGIFPCFLAGRTTCLF